MTDYLTRVREQAAREVESRGETVASLGSIRSAEKEEGFVIGAAWLASRLAREKIAGVIEANVDLALSSRLVLADAILALMVEGEK